MIRSIEEILPLVSKPARYVGGEVNSVSKDWAETSVRVALAFPETYEIGMSHLGLKILYHIINARPSCPTAADRLINIITIARPHIR